MNTEKYIKSSRVEWVRMCARTYPVNRAEWTVYWFIHGRRLWGCLPYIEEKEQFNKGEKT
jgi:hypothetical protein